MIRQMGRPRVVIVGAGFAGLTLARSLKGASVDVTLLDRNNYHLFTPLLYQVAAAYLDPSQIANSIRALIRGIPNCDFRLADVNGVELERRVVLTDHGEVSYDQLVLCTGSGTNYFGIRGMEARSLGLKELPEAMALRNWVLERFELSRWELDPVRRRRLLSFVVVGGGPTGVEFAGALAELIRLVLRKDFRDLDLAEPRVVLLEAAGRVLGTFDPGLSEAARHSLRAKGVEVRLGAAVESVSPAGVRLGGGEQLEAGTVVWTAGVRASELGERLGVALERQARVPVGPSMQLEGHPEVFVIGDLAAARQGGEVLPMLILVAMQEARYVAAVIIAAAAGRPAPVFAYRDPGIMATIGRNAAVAQLGRVRLSGFPGWVMWLAVHLINIVSLRNRLVVLVNWAWDYLFYDRPVRLMVRAQQPRKRA